MGSAISIGTTGLTASSKQMDVIGNNLANSNTLGFKTASTLFTSMLNQSLAGSGAMSVGQGVTVAAIATQFAQGSFENTPNATDMAIDGNGFFIVKDTEGALYYTRAGSFHINKEGNLVDNTGYNVQGYNLFSAAQTIGTDDDIVQLADDISLSNVQSSASATTDISIGANLDEAEGYGGKFNVTQSVFDSKGAMHNLSVTFQKTEVSGVWGFDAKLDGVLSITADQSACGITFDTNGAFSGLYKGDIGGVTAVSSGTIVETTISKPGQLYKDTTTPILLTKAAQNVWTVTADGGYTNALAWQERSGGVEYLKLDLDGKGGSDIVFDIGAASVGTTEAATVTFDALTAGQTMIVGGLTFTATGGAGATAAQVADAFDAGVAGATAGGVMTGALVDYTVSAGAATTTVFTSTTADTNVADLTAGGTGAAPGIAIVQGSAGSLWATGDTVTFDIVKTDVASQDLVLTFGDLGNGATIGESTGSGPTIENNIAWNLTGDDAHVITSYASTSVVKSLYCDGYSSGVLKGLSIGSDGIISGFFTNGQTSNLAQIVLADFPNTSGLKKVGNYFGMTNDSGVAITNAPGSRGLGEILSNSLEMSNTDVAKEFVNMITAQRSYQASAKLITTADQMLTILMNIKQ